VTPAGWTDAKQAGNIPLWQKEPAALRYMEYLPEGKTLYVRHSAVANQGDNTIESFFNQMADFIEKNDVEKLILDVRMNGGGNNYLNKPVISSIIRSEKINKKGKFFCILGRKTFSAAQNLVNELEKYTEVTFVGEPTSENVNFYGDTKVETLPNSKLPVHLSWLWWQNSDPRDKRKATSPQLAVDMSFNDYYNNNDPVLKTILDYDKMKPLLPTLTNLINTGKKGEALQFAMDYKKDPINKYYVDRIETDLNQEGYNHMESKLEVASALFEINMKLFPESPNTYDSYAESLLAMGKKQEAIKYYEMAIAKDKNGTTAQNARNVIEKIKSGN
jgi:tetratricopeptide (TPR) repeat protein